MTNNTGKTCCFTGHRVISAGETGALAQKLRDVVRGLGLEGYTRFLCGGALGFDLMAAWAVAALKEQGHPFVLELVLPCKNHDALWSAEQKMLMKRLLQKADKATVLEENYSHGCMLRRNEHMVRRSTACVAYLRKSRSGTGQTVRCAKANGLRIIEL